MVVCCGGVLLSRRVAPAVPLALAGLASGFGMGPGVSPPPWPPQQYATSLQPTALLALAGARGCGWGLVNRIVDARRAWRVCVLLVFGCPAPLVWGVGKSSAY